MELRYTEGLSNFRPRVTAVMQVEEVSVRGFDLKAKQKVEQTAKTVEKQITEAGIKRSEMVSAFPGGKLEIAGQSFSSDSEAKTMAQATLDQLANAYLGAEGVCEGDPPSRRARS